MILIRHYREKDYEVIRKWWEDHREPAPLPGMMIEDGTHVLCLEDQPVMTLTAFTTQSKDVALLEGFCAKPGMLQKERNVLSQLLFARCLKYLKDRGVRSVFMLTNEVKLKKRFEQLGLSVLSSKLWSLGKEI